MLLEFREAHTVWTRLKIETDSEAETKEVSHDKDGPSPYSFSQCWAFPKEADDPSQPAIPLCY